MTPTCRPRPAASRSIERVATATQSRSGLSRVPIPVLMIQAELQSIAGAISMSRTMRAVRPSSAVSRFMHRTATAMPNQALTFSESKRAFDSHTELPSMRTGTSMSRTTWAERLGPAALRSIALGRTATWLRTRRSRVQPLASTIRGLSQPGHINARGNGHPDNKSASRQHQLSGWPPSSLKLRPDYTARPSDGHEHHALN